MMDEALCSRRRSMKAVLQRVINASVAVEGKTISSIGKGLLVLVGIDKNDTPTDSTALIKKILSAKLFDDDEGRAWKMSIKDIDGEILCVSQFTLFAQFKGTKPSFHESMSTEPGKAMYMSFLDEIKAAYKADKIQDGEFGAMMQVSLCNDGPVTMILSSLDNRRGGTKKRDDPASASGTSTPVGDGTLAEGKAGKKKVKGPSGVQRPEGQGADRRMGDRLRSLDQAGAATGRAGRDAAVPSDQFEKDKMELQKELQSAVPDVTDKMSALSTDG